MADTLESIVSNGLCQGCGGCSATSPGNIVMALNEAGYFRPKTTGLSANEQQRAVQICSGLALEHSPMPPEIYSSLWGPILRLATGYAADSDVRFRGSSGGVISAVCIYLLESRKVDFILSTSSSRQDPLGNATFERRSREDVLEAAGSRYAPSSPLADIERYLAANETFAFVGKPCDVATLRRMALHDPRIDAKIPYKLSFFCAGTPSRQGTLDVIKKLGVEEADVSRFNYRGEGWPGLARATRHDGSSETMDYNSSWGNILNRHLQFRCKICPDGTGEFADIVCADAWYGKDGYPDFAERDGRSLIVARTRAGLELIEAMEQAEAIRTHPLDIAEIEKMQPYQANRKRNTIARVTAVGLSGHKTPRYRRLNLVQLALNYSLLQQARNLYGTLRRIWGKKSL